MSISLSILEYKEIIEAIKKHANVDISQHSMAAMRTNLAEIISELRISSTSDFVQAIIDHKRVRDLIIANIYNEHINLFRDPAMWKILKTDLIDTMLKTGNIKIWLPEVSKGSDFYTLLIFLKINNLQDKVRIVISDESQQNLDLCKTGFIDNNLLINSEMNIKRLDSHLVLNNYLETKDKKTYLKAELMKGFIALKGNLLSTTLPFVANIILFRNKMIYYNHVKEQKVINHFYQNLTNGGYLIVGVKEDLTLFDIDKKFKLYNQEEQIYKRHFS
jgi:chemotaxis protein methyltransferase CheR